MPKLLQYNGIEWVEIAKNGKDANEQRIINKVISKIPPAKDGYTPIKGIDYFDGKDGSPDTGKEIVDKINDLPIKPAFQIDASHIKNLPKQMFGKRAILKGAASPVMANDLSSQCDGSTKTFTVPTHKRSIMLTGTDFPIIYRPTIDFTTSGQTLTLTDQVAAPSAGATLVFVYHE